jgi:hypothetical protein
MFPIKPMTEVNDFDKHPTELRPKSASQKFIAIVFNKIVTLWPADSRDWALAMQAELPQMESTQESLQWLAGGIMSLGKAWWNGALSSDKKEHAPVKKPGILAALVTVAALALLLIPSANQGLRAVLLSWRPNSFAAQQAQFLQMAHEAESRGDAKTVAFAAMRFESRKDFVSFANKAVALDPSLTWIYSQGHESDSWLPDAHDWAAKLQAWDPGNATGYLVQAELRRAELIHDGWRRRSGGDAPQFDTQWMECGRKAMESPRYDSYRSQQLQLDREVIRTHGLKDLEVIWRGAFPSRWSTLWPVQVYSKIVLDEAKAAVARGDKQTATRDAWAVAHFGELLRARGATEGERRSGVEYLRRAYTILQPLLAAEGRNDEAAIIAEELEATKPGAPGSGAFFIWTDSFSARVRAASVEMHLGAAFTLLFASALLLAGLWILAKANSESMRSGGFYRAACRVARFAPAGLLASLALLAASYSPTADAVSSYLYRPISNATIQDLTAAYASLYWVSNDLRYSNLAPYHPAFWMIVMALGVLTIAMIIGRNILNRTPRPKVATT